MKPTIPNQREQIVTSNTKEAALLYSLADIKPHRLPDGSLSAVRLLVDGEERVTYLFEQSPLANMIHAAFSTPGWEDEHAGNIPDEYMPKVVALIKTAFHNMERCRDAVKQLQLHRLVCKNGKVYIAKEAQ